MDALAVRPGAGARESDRIPDDGAPDLTPQVRNRVGYGAELVAGVGAGMARSTLDTAGRAVRGMRELSREAAAQLPRLARLEQIQPSTRISLGLVVEERRAERARPRGGDQPHRGGGGAATA